MPSAPPSASTDTPTDVAQATSDPPAEAAEPTSTLPEDMPLLRVNGAEFPVELAVTLEERSQGLSGRDSLPSGTGMLFIYEADGAHTFWMKDMRFPLDFVWISGECLVVEVTAGAPPPEPGQSPKDLPRYSPPGPVRYILEINAGEAETADIDPGDMVEFAGSRLGTYGCRPG